MADKEKFLIWSHEHRQWWGPNRGGYTPHVEMAGRYDEAEAGFIVVGVIPPGIEVAVYESIAKRSGTDLIYGMEVLHAD